MCAKSGFPWYPQSAWPRSRSEAKTEPELQARVPRGVIQWFQCCSLFLFQYTVKPASSQHVETKRKKNWIISVNCRRPARNLWTLGRPDHGPKNGATNLEASLGPESGPILGAAKHTRELLHRAPYRQQGEILWYMCCRQCGLAIHDAVHYIYNYIYIIC